MERIEIIEKINEIFYNNNILNNNTELNESVDLFSLGLNSMGVIDIVVNLEEIFEFEFRDDDLPFDNFETISKIADVVERRINYAD